MQIFKNPNFDFVKYRWHAIALSVVVIVAGLIMVAIRGLPLGVEFSGGTIVIVGFDQAPPSIDRIRSVVGAVTEGGGQNLVVQRYGEDAQRQIMIRLPHVGEEKGMELSRVADRAVKALTDANLGRFDVAGTEIIGPVVGADLTRKGLWATGLSLLGILTYIAIRFRLSFAVGAIVATIHDLLVMMTFLVFFGYDLSLNVIAAILTIIGYSVNDTVVIFDRVRENLKGMRKESTASIINVAVNQTLGRTVITAGTTLLSVLALFFFGGEVLHGFAFVMLVGVISGTYSTVFVAVAVVAFWRPKAAARVPAASTPPAVAGGNGKPAPTARQRARKNPRNA